MIEDKDFLAEVERRMNPQVDAKVEDAVTIRAISPSLKQDALDYFREWASWEKMTQYAFEGMDRAITQDAFKDGVDEYETADMAVGMLTGALYGMVRMAGGDTTPTIIKAMAQTQANLLAEGWVSDGVPPEVTAARHNQGKLLDVVVRHAFDQAEAYYAANPEALKGGA